MLLGGHEFTLLILIDNVKIIIGYYYYYWILLLLKLNLLLCLNPNNAKNLDVEFSKTFPPFTKE